MLYSSFVEHIGRAVYGGIYEPTHPTADENGFREDVLALVKRLRVPLVRYPGGNFVSGYNWKNGIGKKSERPATLDLAWKQLEPNEMGVDEFMLWAKKANVQPIMAVNMGTGTPQEAFELLQYCNATVGYWAELRAKNGHPEPYNIQYWCIGNEMDGDWQIGHLTAEQYAEKAQTTARMFKTFDPSLKLIFCGSSNFEIPTFLSWERTILEKCFHEIDYVSAHRYYYFNKETDKVSDYVKASRDFDDGLKKIEAVIDEVKHKYRSDKNIPIAFDEWNVWHNTPDEYDWDSLWTVGPKRAESTYTALDATVFSSLLAVLINHADRVGIACYAQLVNVIAPILTANDGGVVAQTIFYPLEKMSEQAGGKVIECQKQTACEGLEMSAVLSKEGDKTTCLLCNLTGEEKQIQFVGEMQLQEITLMHSEDLFLQNTVENPSAVLPATTKTTGNAITLPPYAWCVATCDCNIA